MVFHKLIEKIYRSQLFSRCDETGLVHYFSYEDFDGLQREDYQFKSSLEHNLKGYFYNYEKYDRTKLIIFEHGFGGGHRSYMKEIEMLCSAGFRVFAYDHTGCMESEGEGARGFSQSLHDLDDCLNALKKDKKTNSVDIYVIGHSWGGFSTLNISAIHSEIKKIVVLSGFISVEKIIEQNFSGLLKGYRKYLIELERESNPDYIHYDAVATLENAKTQALLIYSDNDPLVKKEIHYNRLHKALSGKTNIEFLLVKDKFHNPNYTYQAVKYLAKLTKETKKAKNVKTAEEKEVFRKKFDWHKMTEQDDQIWEKIFRFLKQ